MALLDTKTTITPSATTQIYGANGAVNDGRFAFSLIDNSAVSLTSALTSNNTTTLDAVFNGTTTIAKVPQKTETGAYSFVQADAGVIVDIDNIPTFPSLAVGTVLSLYNTTASAIAWVSTGLTVDNTSDLKISAKGHVTVVYKTATNIRIVGETEA